MSNSEQESIIPKGHQNQPEHKHSERALTNFQLLSYGVGHVLNDLTASMWFSYLLVFLHQVVHFNNFLAGYLVLIGQIADALCTPFVGIESDRTRKGFFNLGKRKSWHFVGTVCVLVSFPFIFQLCITCAHAPNIAQFVYYAPFVVIFQFGWASVQISHLSYSSELTPYKHERVTLQSIRNFFTIFANLSVYGIFSLLFQFGDDNSSTKNVPKPGNSSIINSNPTDDLSEADAPNFRNLTFICLGIGIIFNVIFYAGTARAGTEKKEEHYENGTAEGEVLSTIEISTIQHSKMTWKDWLKEHHFYQIAVLYMATRLYINISQVYFSMYLTETIKLHKIYIAILPLFTNSSSFLTSILAPFVNKLLGRKMTYFVGLLFGFGATVWMYFLGKQSHQVYGAAVLLGVAGSILLITSLSMTSDLISSNTESGAFVFGAMSFTDKLSNGITILVIQKFHPCVNCCPACDPYYREVQTYVPGAALVIAFIILLTLIPQDIGTRKGKPKTELLRANTNAQNSVAQCSCGEFYTAQGTCVYCIVNPQAGAVTHFPQIHEINNATLSDMDDDDESNPLIHKSHKSLSVSSNRSYNSVVGV